MKTTTYYDDVTDKFGRTLEYHVHGVPYEGEGEEGTIFKGSVINRILHLRDMMREVAERMDTKQKHWIIDIDYDTGRMKLRR